MFPEKPLDRPLHMVKAYSVICVLARDHDGTVSSERFLIAEMRRGADKTTIPIVNDVLDIAI
jgi:hypothetical protein